jgi:hypothetical protein
MTDAEILAEFDRLVDATSERGVTKAEHKRRVTAAGKFMLRSGRNFHVISDMVARMFPDGPPIEGVPERLTKSASGSSSTSCGRLNGEGTKS